MDVRLQPGPAQAAGGGYYLVTFKTWWTAAASGYYAAKVMLNGATNLHTDKRTAAGADDALPGFTGWCT